MKFFTTLSFFKSLVATSLKASISLRGIFLVEFFLMTLSNLLFFALWWIFFNQIHDINGWGVNDITLLLSISMGSYGMMQVFFGGVRYLSRMIQNGELDSYMTQPKNLLLHLISSRTYGKGWGDIFTAILLLFFGKQLGIQTLSILLLSMILGCIVFTSMSVIAHSLSFWLGSIDSLAKQYSDSLFIFSSYPQNIYKGLLKMVMFSFIPAGVIGLLPVELIKAFSFFKLFLMIAAAAFFVATAMIIFNLGLKRYESGNHFTVR